MTLRQLRDGARDRADMANASRTINDEEANSYINEATHELYDLITECDDARLFVTVSQNPQPLGSSGNIFLLPQDFYRLVSLSILDGSVYLPGIPADPSKEAELAALTNNSTSKRPFYFVRWDFNTGVRMVYVYPAPGSSTIAITYWPQPKPLTSDSEQVDNPASWLEFVMTGAAIRMVSKVERDATALLLKKRELETRIMKAVYASDFNSPKMIRDLGYRYG
jgi:hypothetical protein